MPTSSHSPPLDALPPEPPLPPAPVLDELLEGDAESSPHDAANEASETAAQQEIRRLSFIDLGPFESGGM